MSALEVTTIAFTHASLTYAVLKDMVNFLLKKRKCSKFKKMIEKELEQIDDWFRIFKKGGNTLIEFWEECARATKSGTASPVLDKKRNELVDVHSNIMRLLDALINEKINIKTYAESCLSSPIDKAHFNKQIEKMNAACLPCLDNKSALQYLRTSNIYEFYRERGLSEDGFSQMKSIIDDIKETDLNQDLQYTEMIMKLRRLYDA